MSLSVLVVEDEDNARSFVSTFLKKKGYEVFEASTLDEARERVKKGDGDVVLLDVQLHGEYGLNLLYETAMMPARPPIIVITGFGSIDMAVDAMKNGATDFLQKPLDMSLLEKSLQRAREIVAMRRELEHYREAQMQKGNFVIGTNEVVKNTVQQALVASEKQVSVLITGETGTGKDVIAKYIHSIGPRANKPFISINCAAIQSTMLESELFGHEAGAFTSADRKKPGLMEIADGGVLFLNEIASMPVDIQAKLLTAIETHTFRRVGGTALIKVDVQIIAASNRNLKEMIKKGDFREDLYYRLKVVDLDMPPLRERKEDIPELVGFFIRENNARQGMNVVEVSPKAMEVMQQYSWPGNIRELSNAIERAMLFCDGMTINLADLPKDLTST
ncbi:MAG TPA: sigma-54 dependent transcriptional regulator [Anaerolineaceae bacterium]|nr:sigma-54 dependent transcriptional regulator [Anaerolineaceae bacterium]HOS53819.1 sigma-54 dependent transcriptional regulator [Anaerolineaceae bacterium]HPD62092.1 sigma-54 dependent transcriptional regulator [Anaerolineaceae bacterium]HQF69251.1 sigma-54 dependent transcriptional regulator [Anaerolineaceae bacterium]HRT91871.1 sigma-54 dependent transcriptional regulator [Anaerolineaceae bacterium]